MAVDRRDFLKITGIGALGLSGVPVVHSLVGAGRPDPSPSEKEEAHALSEKRWAMVVDMKKCRATEGCRDCFRACHAVHNVPDFGSDTNHEIKWIWPEAYENAFPEQQHDYTEDALKKRPVPLLCNHCDNPPCVKVCPTQATFRRDVDGIVLMDFHRCIGCRYCVAACPYGSRSFNWLDPRKYIEKTGPDFPTRTKGVVEKCNFCAERLAKGLVPKCVEVCPEKALAFGDLRKEESEMRDLLRKKHAIRRKPGLGTDPEVYYIV